MESPAWLPKEQPSTSQASGSDPHVEGQSSAPSTPTAAPASVVGTPTLKVGGSNGSDSLHDSAPANIVTSGGSVDSTPSFSYTVRPDVNTTSGGSSQQSSSSTVMMSSPGSSSFPKPPIPDVSTSSGPSFSYNISQAEITFSSGQQFHPRMAVASGQSEVQKNVSHSAASLQPPVPGQFARPSSFLRGMTTQVMPPLSPVGVPREASPNAANFSYNGNHQLPQKDRSFLSNPTGHVAQGPSASSASSVSHSVSQPAHPTSNARSLNSNFASPTYRMPSAPHLQVPPGGSRAPVTYGSPGRAPVPSPSGIAIHSSPVPSPSSLRPGSVMPTTSIQSNSSPQLQINASYASNPLMVAPSQGLWLQPAPVGGLARSPLLPYPSVIPGSFPLSTHRTPPFLALPSDAKPPAASIGPPGLTSVSSAVCASMPALDSGPLELPPGVDNSKHVNIAGVKEESVAFEKLDAWSAHRTETGTVYYYNAVTGESTYQKPAGFKGEPDKVIAQPTPISWEKCSGTDWSLVTTNDGKRYYYNSKTKLSSWQIPTEVTELRKMQDGDACKEQPMSVPSTTTLTEKGSVPLSLSAPAINTGGRDAIALRTSGVPVSSSALDLIKKKLQDSAAPATTTLPPASTGAMPSELNGSIPADVVGKSSHCENGKGKGKDDNADENLSDSSSDSEDIDNGPTREECTIQFKDMLKERGVAPFSKWEKELPKIVFDPRFKAIPSYSARRTLFEHFVRTRAEEERKEKRAAQKAAVEGFKQLLNEAVEDIDHNTDYQTFKRKWGHDPRFEVLDRKEREILLNERVLPLKRSVEEEARSKRATLVSSFKSMLQDNMDICTTSRWSKVKDILRNDPRYKSVKHEDREALFNEYISELKTSTEEAERAAKAKRDEEEKLKERERALRKRKEREEQEVERVRSKARRKEAIESYQALLVETIKDPQVSWTDSKPKLEKDPQGRAANPYLDQSDLEKLFREHVKLLHERCAHEFRSLLADVITSDAAAKEYEGGKTVFNSWSTAKRLLKDDTRYIKMPRKDRESVWRRHVDDLQRRQKSTVDQDLEKVRNVISVDSRKYHSGSRRTHDRR